MKRFLLLLFFFSMATGMYANTVDELKTNEDVALFLTKVNKRFFDKGPMEIKIYGADSLKSKLPCYATFGDLNLTSWQKADFDQDGNTDLLVIPYWHRFEVYVVMDNGDDTFRMVPISRDIAGTCMVAKATKVQDEQLLVVYKNVFSADHKQNEQFIDTLVYKFGGFVELNRRPASYRIKTISFSTSHCFGSCPVFSIDIYGDGFARYMAVDNNPTSGDFEAQLTEEAFANIVALINYIDVNRLKDNYEVAWTDDQTARLRVQFRDGTSKSIRDYGLLGTFGLSRLFDVLAGLRLNQDWR